MDIPKLPIDILHLICSWCADDLRTLYSLALSSRICSTIALPALYANLVKFPSDYDDEDRLAEHQVAYTKRLTKWSSLWKTLALSAQNPSKTSITYVSFLRFLNLRDLLILMEEYRTPRGQMARTKFFTGDLKKYNKCLSNGIDFDYYLAADCLTDLITSAARNVTTLIRQTKLSGHFRLWLPELPALESLRVFSGETLANQDVRDALVHCPNLKSLEIYHWLGEKPDEALAAFLRSIAGNGLEKLVIKGGYSCFQELTLSALSDCHGSTLTELEIGDIYSRSLPAFSLASRITNLRSCILSISSIPGEYLSHTVVETMSNFLAQNTHLENLILRMLGIHEIVVSFLPSLKLKHLSISDGQIDDTLPSTFWSAFTSQADSLQSLYLDTSDEYTPSQILPSYVLDSISSLHQLRHLTIKGFVRLLKDMDVEAFVKGCPLLEELSLGGIALTDESFIQLSSLRQLTTFTSMVINKFTPRGVAMFIELMPQLSALTIHVDGVPGLFSVEDWQRLTNMMEARGGTGFTCIEEGYDDESDDGDMDADFVPVWE